MSNRYPKNETKFNIPYLTIHKQYINKLILTLYIHAYIYYKFKENK